MSDNSNLTPEMLVPRLGDYLVDRQLLTADELKKALVHQKTLPQDHPRRLLGQIIVDLHFIEQSRLDRAITEQILQLRSALEQANAQLEARVLQRTAELKEALNKLSELSKLKSNFVSNISHELRTPMTHIKGYLELLCNEDLGPVTKEQKMALVTLQKSSDRLEQMIEDLILFSMSERDQIMLRLQPVSVRDMCETVIQHNTQKAQAKAILLLSEIQSDMPLAQADPQKIDWVINQILDNAIKFTPAPGKVVIRCFHEEPFIRIIIEDTGIGIPEQRLNEIFEAFHQLDGSSTRKYGGTGLGLNLVKKIVEAHGSTIKITSQEGKGSTFEFSLKVAS
ncbi:MAG: HAMP domain-containing histidine kinase [Anaerolineaceae bacterium]|nr:HAMP domain-containing histidine kinase [Anaerolineaceae bacterium]NTV35890.1 HAMP domain-containing histidine kinase [Anaerolineaceae bacterium]